MQTGIAIDGRNTVHVIYYNPGDERLKYTKRVNGQTAWSSPINVVDKTVAPQSALALEADTTPHVVFYEIDATGSRAGVKHAEYNGTSWTTPDTVEAFVGTDTFVSIAVGSDRFPRVAYHNSVTSSTVLGIHNGVAWSTYTVYTSTYEGAVALDLAADNTARIAFVSWNTIADKRQVRFAVGKSTTNLYLGLGEDIPIQHDTLSLTVDTLDQSHVAVYFSSYNALEYFALTSTGGVAALPPAWWLNGGGSFNAIAVDSSNHPRVVFSSSTLGLLSAVYDGSSWTLGTLDGTAGDTGVGPSLVFNRYDHYLVGYYSGTSSVTFQTDATLGLTLGGTLTDFSPIPAPIPGATVSLTGNIANTTLAAGAGSYTQGDLWEGGYTVTPSASGMAFQPANAFRALTTLPGDSNVNFQGGPVSVDLADNLFDPSRGESMSVDYSVIPGHVLVKVYSVRGLPVKTLVDEDQAAGTYTVSWNGRDDAGEIVASGVYLIRIEAYELKSLLKAVVVK